MKRVLAGVWVAGVWWVWWPWPAPGIHPVVDLVMVQSPALGLALHGWHYAAPGIAAVGTWSLLVAVGRVWLGGGGRGGGGRGTLPSWPLARHGPGAGDCGR